MRKDKLLEEIWEARKQAIKEADRKLLEKIKQNIVKKPQRQRNNLPLIILMICLVLGFVFFISVVISELIPEKIIEYKTEIVEKQPIIQKEIVNVTYYLQPNNTANCIKIEEMVNGTLTGKFTMSCERVK